MNYEEKVIDGILHFRRYPNPTWRNYTAWELTDMYLAVRKELDEKQAITKQDKEVL